MDDILRCWTLLSLQDDNLSLISAQWYRTNHHTRSHVIYHGLMYTYGGSNEIIINMICYFIVTWCLRCMWFHHRDYTVLSYNVFEFQRQCHHSQKHVYFRINMYTYDCLCMLYNIIIRWHAHHQIKMNKYIACCCVINITWHYDTSLHVLHSYA